MMGMEHHIHHFLKTSSKMGRKQMENSLRILIAKVQRKASGKTPLYGHNSPETAYVVDDYPYGFRLRTQAKFWLEFKPKKGFRLVSQTLDPKRGRWNNPKASTYSEWAGNMYLDSQDHVQWVGLGIYSQNKDIEEFVRNFPKSDLRVLKYVVSRKIDLWEKQIQKGVPFYPGDERWNEDEIGRMRKELEELKQIQKMM